MVANFNSGDSVYASALRDLVDEIDNLVERTASAETALKYADARDMSRMRMALEMGAGTNAKGEVNHTSLANRLVQGLPQRTRKGSRRTAPRHRKKCRRGKDSVHLQDRIGNSGTQTRSNQNLTETAMDMGVRRPISDAYLKAPYLYGSFDPVGELAKLSSYNVGRNLSGGYGDAQDFVSNLFGYEEER